MGKNNDIKILWLITLVLITYIIVENGKEIWGRNNSEQTQSNFVLSKYYSKFYLTEDDNISCLGVEYEGWEEGVINGTDSNNNSNVSYDGSNKDKSNDNRNEKGNEKNNDNSNDAGSEVEASNEIKPVSGNKDNLDKIEYLLSNLDYDYLKSNFYTVDSTTSVTSEILNVSRLVNNDLSIEKDNSMPQILIYHTHSTEKYCDSKDGNVDDTVVGVGDYLTQILTEQGFNVIHDTTSYDVVDGKWNRNAYETALDGIEKILKDNPSIVVAIDLHRNAGEYKEVTTIDGKDTAQIMFFNGVSRTRTGKRNYLSNENLEMNLSFSLQMLLESMRCYDDFAKRIYIKGYRYNLHLLPRSMLLEVGNDKNTVEEAKNAMIPFAKILTSILDC